MATEAEFQVYKVAVLGCRRSGKTTLINKYINNCSDEEYPSTNQDFRVYCKFDCLNKDIKNPRPYFLLLQDLIGVNDILVRSNQELSNMITTIIENQPRGEDIDPLMFPWLQKDRHVYGYIFVVNLSEPHTFTMMKKFIDKITQIEKDRRNDQFIPKKLIVGTMSDKREAFETRDKWELFKNEYESNNIPCFECSYLDKRESIDEIFMALIRELNRDQGVQKFENNIWQLQAAHIKRNKKLRKQHKESQQYKEIDVQNNSSVKNLNKNEGFRR